MTNDIGMYDCVYDKRRNNINSWDWNMVYNNWQMILNGACRSNNTVIIDRILSKGIPKHVKVNMALNEACTYCNPEAVGLMIKYGAKELHSALIYAGYEKYDKNDRHIEHVGWLKRNMVVKILLDHMRVIKNRIFNKRIHIMDKMCNVEYLYDKQIQMWLLNNGIMRNKLVNLPNITGVFDEMDKLNVAMFGEICKIFIKDLAQIISKYSSI